MTTWISIQEVCSQLSVRPQTVYAYVSRGKIEVMPDSVDTRKSLYRGEDVAALAKRKHDGRKYETLANNTLFGSEPSIPTELSSFFRGQLYYRGQAVVALAQSTTLEAVAQLLWGAQDALVFTEAAMQTMPTNESGRLAAFTGLAHLAAKGRSTRGLLPRVLHEEAHGLVALVANAFGARQGGGALLHQQFANGWRLKAQVSELIRMVLVLLADHELTSSAFAARIAASTGASLPACLLAGLTTLSGPLHGDATGRIQALFDEVERLGEDKVINHYLAADMPLAGFGHHLYPDGDQRALTLLAMFEPTEVIASFIQKVTHLTGLKPNIDLALVALVARYKLPADAAFGLIATARSVGLLAHCIEQLNVAQMIRPRGRYVGLPPHEAQNVKVTI